MNQELGVPEACIDTLKRRSRGYASLNVAEERRGVCLKRLSDTDDRTTLLSIAFMQNTCNVTVSGGLFHSL